MRIILDACWNHGGDMDIAKKMIDTASTFGATDIKFQMGRNLPWWADHEELIEHCDKKSIHYLCTAFDKKAVDTLVRSGVDEIKIGSAEAANLDFVKYVVDTGRKIIISTGGMDYEMIGDLACVLPIEAIVMHCVSIYPTPYDKINLNVITDLLDMFQYVGFSDHSISAHPCFGAIALGACAVEKHFMLEDKGQKDAVVSIDPFGLPDFIRGCLVTELSLGHEKIFHDEEKEVMRRFR